MVTVLERLLAKTSSTGAGCLEFTGYRDHHGYGRLRVAGRSLLAHRVAYELQMGQIAEGLTLDHVCRNRACVNVDHLEAVTLAENKRRGQSPARVNAAKTHCNRGHALTPENVSISREGWRRCKACHRQWNRDRYERLKAAA